MLYRLVDTLVERLLKLKRWVLTADRAIIYENIKH